MSESKTKQELLFIHYLGHSAWLITKQDQAWLFDYGQLPRRSQEKSLAGGTFQLADLGQRQAAIFFSHLHQDHWHEALARQALAWPDTQVFLGLSRPSELPAGLAGIQAMLPRTTYTAGQEQLVAGGSTDQGVCFLVRSGKLLFYHGGDLAAWDDTAEYKEGYRREVDWLVSQLAENERPLLAFLPVATSDGYQEEPLLAGIDYLLKRIRPHYILPMHAFGHEHLYDSFAAWLDRRPSGGTLLKPARDGAVFQLELKNHMQDQA